MKIIKISLIIILAVVLILFCFAYQLSRPAGYGPDKIIIVSPGESLTQAAFILKQNNLIRSVDYFKFLAVLSRSSTQIQAGEYKLSPQMSSAVILKKLVKGEVVAYLVTVPEGFTIKKIAKLLSEKHIADEKSFSESAENNQLKIKIDDSFIPKRLEGYLFPDTYLFSKQNDSPKVINIMINRFKETVLPIYNSKKNSRTLDLHKLITLASLVEAEAQKSAERPVIASVYYNRLKKGQLLECDATVQYVLDKHKENITYQDLKTDSPYNTYLYPGLPPGPIGNPGLDSIKACLEPSKTDYYYYVRNDVANDGSHIFSKTYTEHLRAISKYQK